MSKYKNIKFKLKRKDKLTQNILLKYNILKMKETSNKIKDNNKKIQSQNNKFLTPIVKILNNNMNPDLIIKFLSNLNMLTFIILCVYK